MDDARPLEPLDEGQEQRALQAPLIQLIWATVAGGDQHQALVPQPRKQPVQGVVVVVVRGEQQAEAFGMWGRLRGKGMHAHVL
jgi:hypothetical protein